MKYFFIRLKKIIKLICLARKSPLVNLKFTTPYFGKIQYGTPYFYPRHMIYDRKTKTYKFKTAKWFKIDLIGLGWKTKWHETDFRFETPPIFSIVIFNRQFYTELRPKLPANTPEYGYFFIVDEYWELLLYYGYIKNNIKTKKEALQKLYQHNIGKFVVSSFKNGKTIEKSINVYDWILKK